MSLDFSPFERRLNDTFSAFPQAPAVPVTALARQDRLGATLVARQDRPVVTAVVRQDRPVAMAEGPDPVASDPEE